MLFTTKLFFPFPILRETRYHCHLDAQKLLNKLLTRWTLVRTEFLSQRTSQSKLDFSFLSHLTAKEKIRIQEGSIAINQDSHRLCETLGRQGGNIIHRQVRGEGVRGFWLGPIKLIRSSPNSMQYPNDRPHRQSIFSGPSLYYWRRLIHLHFPWKPYDPPLNHSIVSRPPLR